MVAVLFIVTALIVVPLNVWHFAGYFTGRYDEDV